jgi:hypothetical protein
VRFLLYADGYRWLAAESAIVSPVRLADLQVGLAALDWKLWNSLWSGEQLERGKRRPMLRITVSWGGKTVEARDLVRGGAALGEREMIFFGSPSFDDFVLGACSEARCSECPAYSLEKAQIEKSLPDMEGEIGYELNAERFPAVGTEVEIRMFADHG